MHFPKEMHLSHILKKAGLSVIPISGNLAWGFVQFIADK